MSYRLVVLAGDYVEDYEVMVPVHTFEVQGYTVDVAAPGRTKGDTIKTAVHVDGGPTYAERPGHPVRVTTTFADLDPAEVDGVLIPGGRAPEYIRNREGVIDFVQTLAQADKPIGAMCHGIQVLTAADLVDGHECTAFPDLEPDVRAAGGVWTDDRVAIDDTLVTAQGYEDLTEWLSAFQAVLTNQDPHATDDAAPSIQ